MAGTPAKGASAHVEGCQCTRCVGFQPGNDISLCHGAYASPVRLSDEVDELAAGLAPLVPAFTASDGPAVQLLALTLRRIARAEPIVSAAEEAGDLEKAAKLRSDQRGWLNSATRLLDLLALFPGSRAKLGLDVARIRSELDDLAGEGRRIRLEVVEEGER
jgi:hypothetical protein